MSECLFHPDQHATGELGVEDPLAGRMNIPICEDCLEAYDELQAEYLRAEAEAERGERDE